ncbi:hypothetical protein H5410_025937 [Solanum commersonii]|uniref:Uncharacterized protein n=1 Tax=Solanum commersonii TaxID=4109 RepID=A0A9J5YX98_SOLCO|nr:hypothetical protein H5410_025937 [Solanum commersonii]
MFKIQFGRNSKLRATGTASHVCSIKFITQSRSIEFTIFFFRWKDNSKNYTMYKNHGQRLCGLVLVSLQSQLMILPRSTLHL